MFSYIPIIISVIAAILSVLAGLTLRSKKINFTNTKTLLLKIGRLVFGLISGIVIIVTLLSFFLGINNINDFKKYFNNNPSPVVTFDTPGESFGLCVDRDFIYLADGKSGLQIIDILDKENPKIISNIDNLGEVRDIFFRNDYVYLISNDLFSIVDVSNKYYPKNVGNISYNDKDSNDYYINNKNRAIRKFPAFNSIYVSDDYAYLTDGLGLKIIDVSVKTNPHIVCNVTTYYNAVDVFIQGNYAYVTTEIDGLQIIDISDKTNPFISGIYDTPGMSMSVVVNDKYAYIADFYKGLQIVNLASGMNNPDISNYLTNIYNYDIGMIEKVQVVQDKIYSYSSSTQLSDFFVNKLIENQDDYSLTLKLKNIGICKVPGFINDFKINGNYAYFANRQYGIQIYKLSDL